MGLIINQQLFIITPYISTSWSHVTALSFQEGRLVVFLTDGAIIHLPALPEEVMMKIFEAHTSYLQSSSLEEEKEPSIFLQLQNFSKELGQTLLSTTWQGSTPFLEGVQTVLRHDSRQSSSPDLPKEMLDRICSIAKELAPDGAMQMAEAEPHCNCFHCQITRALQREFQEVEEKQEEAVQKVEEMSTNREISPWNVEQCGKELFTVTSRLEGKESYKVFLGEPVGCTCGQTGCEHILAALRS